MRAVMVRPGEICLLLIDKKVSFIIKRINTVPAKLESGSIYQRFDNRPHGPLGCDSTVEVVVFHAPHHGMNGSSLQDYYSPLDFRIFF